MLQLFNSIDDARSRIGFTDVWKTSSPTLIETLLDDKQTFVVSFEFNSEKDQLDFKQAIDEMFHGNPQHFKPKDPTDVVEHFKTEWLHKDGSLSHKTDFIFTKKGRDISPAL